MNNHHFSVVFKEQLSNMDYTKYIKVLILVFSISILITSCNSSDDEIVSEKQAVPLQVITAQGVSVPVYDYQSFSPMLDYYNDTLYIFNFWATWCQPCVKELPYFNMADSAFADKPVRIILVSLDFVENVEDMLIPFMIEKDIQAEVIVLDDMDANNWIPMIDPDWEGAIPASLFKQRSARKFMMQSFTYKELTEEIENIINP
jgi:thiol-disulfide isomerase/thioredoxin